MFDIFIVLPAPDWLIVCVCGVPEIRHAGILPQMDELVKHYFHTEHIGPERKQILAGWGMRILSRRKAARLPPYGPGVFVYDYSLTG